LPRQKAGRGEKMEIKEIYVTKLKWDGGELKDEQLKELLISHAKENTKDLEDKVKTAIERLKQHFLEKGYTEDELIAEVLHKINVFAKDYYVDIIVKVYPRMHELELTEQVLQSKNISYIHLDFGKELNELGTTIKNRVALLLRIMELEKENQKLKNKIESLEAELSEAEKELEKYREKCGELTDEDP
jgi:predicted ribosome quality control (RQC) complex YloA/Tae2 family protein